MADNIKIDLLINAAQSAKTIGETKKALRDLKSEALNLKEGTAAFTRVATAAGELQDKISDLSATTKYLGDDLRKIKGISGIGEGIAGGFAMAQGAAALFGGENKKLEESMVKLQAVMAVIQGMTAIGNVLQKESAAVLFIKNTVTKAAVMLGWQDVAATEAQTVATVAETAATEAQVVATESATIAQKLLNLAMKANPIGLLIGLITAGVAALMLWSDASSKAAEAEKKSNEEKKKAADLLKKKNEETKKETDYIAKESTGYVTLIEKLKQTNAGSKERKDLIKQINSTYGATLKNISDEKKFQDQLNGSVQDYIKYKTDEYNLLKNEEKITLNLKKQDDIKKDIVSIEKELLMATVKRNAAIASAPKDFDVNRLPDVIRYNELTKSLSKNQAELTNAEKRMASYTTTIMDTTAEMEKLGFKTDDTMNKSVKSTDKAIDKQKELRIAALKSQEDFLKAKKDMNDQDREDLIDLENKRIGLMKDGFEKEKALLEQAAKEEIDARRQRDAEALKDYSIKYEKAITDRMALDKSSREEARKAVEKDAKEGRAVDAEASARAISRAKFEKDITDKLAIDIAKAKVDADKKALEDSQKLSIDSIEATYKKELDIINSASEYKGESTIFTAEEYIKKLEDVEKAKEDMLKRISSFQKDESVTMTEMSRTDYKTQYQTLAEFTRKQRKMREDSMNEAHKRNKEEFKSGLKDEQMYIEERAAINKKWAEDDLTYKEELNKKLFTISSEGTTIEYNDKKTYLENLVDLFDKKYGRITEIVTEENENKANDQIAADQKALEEKQAFWDQMIELEQQGQQLMMSIFNNAMAQREYTVNKEYENKIAQIDSEMQAYENAQAERTVQQQIEYDIQQGFENQKAAAERARDIELDKVKQKQFNAQKANDLATIAISTAKAIAKTVAELGGVGAITPMGAAIIAGVGITGAVQAGIVASKEYIPSFATGGIFEGNGMVKGPGSGTSDSVNARLSNGEAVINAKSTKMFAPMLSAINEAGGGKAIPHLKNGGIYTEPAMQYQSSSIDTQAIVEAIYSASDRPIETYVKENSITTAQKRAQRLKGRTSF